MSVKNSFIATCFLLSASVAAQVNTSFFLLYEDGLDIHFQVSEHTKMAHVQAASYTYLLAREYLRQKFVHPIVVMTSHLGQKVFMLYWLTVLKILK